MKQEVLIAGFGGQGILLAGQIMAEAAMVEGLYATWFPSYGPEMRGGTANCITIFSDEEIGSPIAAKYDIVIVMNQPSLEKFAPRVRPGGILLVNSTMVPVKSERSDIRAIYIPAGEIAREIGEERVSNVVMLGAFLGVCPELAPSGVEQAIASLIGRKRPEAIPVNRRALEAGRSAALEHPEALLHA